MKIFPIANSLIDKRWLDLLVCTCTVVTRLYLELSFRVTDAIRVCTRIVRGQVCGLKSELVCGLNAVYHLRYNNDGMFLIQHSDDISRRHWFSRIIHAEIMHLHRRSQVGFVKDLRRSLKLKGGGKAVEVIISRCRLFTNFS